MKTTMLVVTAFVLATAMPIRAHHAFGGEFDANRPVLLNARMQTNGYYQLLLNGVVGRKYAIDHSSNVLTWAELITFTNISGRCQQSLEFSASPGRG